MTDMDFHAYIFFRNIALGKQTQFFSKKVLKIMYPSIFEKKHVALIMTFFRNMIDITRYYLIISRTCHYVYMPLACNLWEALTHSWTE